MSIRWNKGAALAAAAALVAFPLLAGQAGPQEQETSYTASRQGQADASPEDRTVRRQLFRPSGFTSLKEYVAKEMEGRYNPATVQTRIGDDGYPEIAFSFFENGTLEEVTIVDRLHFLEYKSETSPAFGAGFGTRRGHGAGTFVDALATEKMAPRAEIIKTCGGLTSAGNPYACCGSVPNDGNCTFAAWELAKRYWGISLPGWSDAGSWYGSARVARIPTSPTVALFSLGVTSTHVGMVTAVNGPANDRKVTLYEEQCIVGGTSLPLAYRPWAINKFVGYVLSPTVNSQSITVYGRSPMYIYSSTADQQVLFSASNIQGNLKAIVTFPSGYVATLEPSAQIWIYGYQTIGTRMRLSEKGSYSIQFFNTNGAFSKMFYFLVL